jgi:cysteine-S-conjugate beta-lyase
MATPLLQHPSRIGRAAAAPAPACARAATAAAAVGRRRHRDAVRRRASAAADGATPYHLSTRLLHPESSAFDDPYLASGSPLYQTATFAQPSAVDMGPYDYTRSGNPTRAHLEHQMALLEGADRALAFTSGMAALAAVAKLAPSGGRIVAGDDLYGGTARLLSRVVPEACGVEVVNVDMTDLEAVRRAIENGGGGDAGGHGNGNGGGAAAGETAPKKKTDLVMIESPTNPRMQVADIRAICAMARSHGAVSCVDNSFMSPLLQRPLELGADISMISGTKYIGGHGDVTLGVLSVRGEELASRLYFLQNAEGAGLAPFDCWLAARGLKTMALRMERAQDNAALLARYLERHPLATRVNYAGLSSHPGSELHASQALGGGAVLSFETGSLPASRRVAEGARLFKITVSFGSVESLASLPCFMSHAAIPAAVRAARGLPDDLVRLAVGVEDAGDLVLDLHAAMAEAMEVRAGERGVEVSAEERAEADGALRAALRDARAMQGAGARVLELEREVEALKAELASKAGLASRR